MKPIYLSRELHRLTHCFCLCIDEPSFRKELKRLKIKEPCPFVKNGAGATVHEFVRSDGPPIAVVCIKPDRNIKPEQVWALLVHEAVHIFQWHLQTIGEKRPSTEFEAYSIQHISQALFFEYSRQKKKKKK